ncbi:cysteine--tRNA ligase [Lutibaculum baratangense]|uniref:Cysteine--tRNA ligase n=1 Tax=Lutibaculum baratangense AMV1 TaxID=631454 RepID=V4RC25_9HYPH|nr:cysteine--tRNA ligase [Lutibaculum baratangense]ESR22914.1 Cysteinyl-tRNA synthetase [Lutibaculum baratangense AMV1]
MTLRLYNTLTHEKQDFVPLDPSDVRMYVCGPTVYDFAHIGNARPVIVFDALFRLLRHVFGEPHVSYARNITDVDDKIIRRAAEEGVAIDELTRRTEEQFHEDVAALHCLPPTIEPRATAHIPEMVAMIETLIGNGHAYAADGHVLFDVKSWTDETGPVYGRLARRSLDEMIAGARVEVAPYKRDPMDFVLWKPAAEGEPGWPSPWSRGRPGWHIECSAMSAKHLGEVFDIHGGGIDLVFPHHENEVAQSCCAHGTSWMAQIFMHNGFLQVEGEKMAKSAGNFLTIRDLLADWPGEVLRLNMLKTHYRQPIDWTEAGLKEARAILDGWYEAAEDFEAGEVDEAVLDALSDDLNTPRAITAMHELRSRAAHGDGTAAASLRASAELMGLMQGSLEDWQSWRPASLQIDEAEVERLIDARIAARKGKDFAEADRIRDDLVAMGVVIMDGKDPQTGELVTRWEVRR